MPFEVPITIAEAINHIHKNEYLLPAIQREFVWNTYQIERLFDSLMRGYPIGSFLFWKVSRANIKNYQFYEFVRDFHERDKRHNPKANTSGENDVTAILDGQQRLTSIYVGLKGSYAYKMPWKRWENDDAFPTRHLYINLLGEPDDLDFAYHFAFLSTDEAKIKNSQKFWFKIGEILNLIEEHEVNDYLIEHELMVYGKEASKRANKTIFKLHSIIHKDNLINYFLEKDEELNRVLNIFIRVNSGGTVLSYSDLLLSIATAEWKQRDAREVINELVDELNNIGDGFGFNKDFVLKSCLVLSDIKDIAFKVDNFNKQNMQKIEHNWENIAESLRLAVTLSASYGYSRYTLVSNAALIPVAYYLMKIGCPKSFVLSNSYKNDRADIKKWLILSMLKRTFSGQPDNVLRPVRQVISKNPNGYPLDQIVNIIKGTAKSLIFSEDDIENLFVQKYGQGYTFSVLSLLYPTLDYRNKFHQDHIFPKSKFTRRKLLKIGITEEKLDFFLSSVDRLTNLQLLEGIPNMEKSNVEFNKWISTTYRTSDDKKNYMKKHYIPDVNLSIQNFEHFYNERKKLLEKKLRSLVLT